MRALTIVPMTLREAHAFVARVHRHRKPSRGGKFAIGAAVEDEVCAVVVVGRPKARQLDDGWTAEVTRLAAIDPRLDPGARNACSLLYAASWRAARAMGYRRMVTYTLPTEPGDSLRGAGWKVVAETKAESWSRSERPRVDLYPEQQKLRWEAA